VTQLINVHPKCEEEPIKRWLTKV